MEFEMRKELSDIVGELYRKHGLTKEVIRLSEILDKLVILEQRDMMKNSEKYKEN